MSSLSIWRLEVEEETLMRGSGHYDSRATDANDFTSDAPGADDEQVLL